MKHYELTYLITPDLSEEELNSFQKIINALIQEEGGVTTESKTPLRKKLAYPIKKMGTAYLGILNFNLAPEKLESLEKKLKTKNQILRYLILIKKPISSKKKFPRPSALEMPELTPASKDGSKRLPQKKIMKPKPEKVELKEIEKKLEEILGE